MFGVVISQQGPEFERYAQFSDLKAICVTSEPWEMCWSPPFGRVAII